MNEKRDVQWYLDRGLVVPGSGEDVALRQRERDRMRIEAEVAKASETAPAIQRLYDLVKMRENEKSPLRGTNSKGLNSKGY